MTSHDLLLGSKAYSYTIIKSSKRRKSLSLQVSTSGEIIVRSPIFVQNKKIHLWLLERASWIEKQLLDLKNKSSLTMPTLKYESRSMHYYLGRQYKLIVNGLSKNGAKTTLLNNIISMETALSQPEVIKNKLCCWYRTQAKVLFQQRLEFFSELMPWVNTPPTLKIRWMKSRWGSCSASGNINLNLHLIKAPIECIDSVIVHELCHLVEFNHSPKFYKLMSTYNPRWKADKKLLNALGKFIIL